MDRIISAANIDNALNTDQCPYCGVTSSNVYRHMPQCKDVVKNIEAAKCVPKDKWGYHQECGRVLLLMTRHGLALIENNYGRYVVPFSDLTFTGIGSLLGAIDDFKPSQDQVQQLIEHLMLQYRVSITEHPIKRGCKVAVHLNGQIRVATVDGNYGRKRYLAKIDDITLNIGRRDIIDIIG